MVVTLTPRVAEAARYHAQRAAKHPHMVVAIKVRGLLQHISQRPAKKKDSSLFPFEAKRLAKLLASLGGALQVKVPHLTFAGDGVIASDGL